MLLCVCVCVCVYIYVYLYTGVREGATGRTGRGYGAYAPGCRTNNIVQKRIEENKDFPQNTLFCRLFLRTQYFEEFDSHRHVFALYF